MQEFEDDDTLRLPVAGRVASQHQDLSRNAVVNRKRPIFLEDDVDEEAYFFDFDTIPRSKVVLPILEDELGDTLRLRAIARPALTSVQDRTGAWITLNGRFVILARILRMFGLGFSSVLIGVILAVTCAG